MKNIRSKCCEKNCDKYAERNNERCREHSVRYYSKYWGFSALYEPKGDDYVVHDFGVKAQPL